MTNQILKTHTKKKIHFQTKLSFRSSLMSSEKCYIYSRCTAYILNTLNSLISVEFFLFLFEKISQLHFFSPKYTNEKKVPTPGFFTYIIGNNVPTSRLLQLHSYQRAQSSPICELGHLIQHSEKKFSDLENSLFITELLPYLAFWSQLFTF